MTGAGPARRPRPVAAAAELTGRYPAHLALAALAAGLGLSPAPAEVAMAVAALAAAGAAGLGSPLLGMGVAVLLLAGGVAGDARLDAVDAGADRLTALGGAAPGRSGQASARGHEGASVPIDARAELLERPRRSRFGSAANVRIVSGPAAGIRLHARAGRGLRWPGTSSPGTRVFVRGSARPLDIGSPFTAHLRRRGVAGELDLGALRSTGARRGGLAGAFDRARERSEQAVAGGLGPREAALARGLVLGQDEAIDDLLRQDFRDAGLGHLLAVSGQNVMLLCALALPLLALAGLGRRGRIAGLLLLIAAYVPLAGAGPSLQRAAVMGAAGLVAAAAGRPASRWYALLLAAAATLALDPRVAGDPGWQLSFAAVAGILLMAPGIRDVSLAALRDRRGGRLRRAVAEGIALTLAATLATLPLLAFHFGAVPLAGLPANLLAMPAVAPIMWIGMLQAALGQLEPLPVAGAVAGAAAHGLSLPAEALLRYLAAVAERSALIAEPLAFRLPVAGVLLGYAALATVVPLGLRAARGATERAAPALARLRHAPRLLRLAAAATGVAAIGFAAAAAWAPSGPPRDLTVSFLDVGQGDATLIQHPDGTAVLFDGGPPEARVVRLLRDAGVRRLDVLVATHASRDHHGGLPEVVGDLPVGVLLDGGDGTADPEFRRMLRIAAARGARVIPARAGTAVSAGRIGLRVLSPAPRPPGPPPGDPNPRAVVAVVSSAGFDLLVSGDAESGALLPLPLPDVEAMKVPHHGSGDDGLPQVLARARPEVATIPVGDNGYGHPAASTLAALDAAVPHVRRTDRDGTVRLLVDAAGMRIATER